MVAVDDVLTIGLAEAEEDSTGRIGGMRNDLRRPYRKWTENLM
jgi:hypothetical protein